MTFKEKIQTIRFAIKLAEGYSKRIYFYIAFMCLFSAAAPLALTFVSARVIDMLTASAEVKSIMIFAFSGVAVSAVLTLGKTLFSRLLGNECDLIHDYESRVYLEQIVNTDYELLEDSEFQKSLKAYKVVYENNGGIYYNLFFSILQFITGMISLVFSLILVGDTVIQCFKIDNSQFITSWKFLALFAAGVALLAVIMSLIGSKYGQETQKSNMRFNKTFAKFKYWIEFPEKYKNGKEIRIYNASDFVTASHGEYLNEFIDEVKVSWRVFNTYGIPLAALQAVLMGAFYLFVAVKAFAGAFSMGSFVLFVGVSLQIAEGINLLTSVNTILGLSAEHAAYLKKLLETPPRKVKGSLPVEKRNDNKFEIEFKNVSFKYPQTDNYVLKNFNAHLEIGSHMAIVGRNGSGKTTFIKLLCRLYDVIEGEITLNGINIKKYDINEYMNLFSVVFQDFQLFSLPLNQNVSTSLEYDREKLYDCLEKAGVADRVKRMPQQEKSVIYKDFDDDGVEISGGEAQKLALARALYKDAPFVILDEPTSALDPVSEFEIYQRFNNFVGDKTAIYISHRLSSCRFCNEIIVFKDGRLVQNGSHDELLADENGEYYKMWNAQAGYYAESKA